jgi:isoquinoline 1-oxidoreductase alpha subunit
LVEEAAMTSLKVNGQVLSVDVDADTPLLWVLREELGLTGTKFGCGAAACGACTVHLDGEPVRSCAVPVAKAAGTEVVTLVGIAAGAGIPGVLHAVQRAWIDIQVPQCGYCQSGMIMATVALLRKSPKPSDEEIEAAIGNLCRCGTNPRVRRAIRALSGQA